MRLALALAAVFAALFTALTVRASLVNSQAANVCRAIATLADEYNRSLHGFDYYRQPEHRDEMAAAHARSLRLIGLLDCQPLPPQAKEEP